jgi:hypothetical protein
MPGFQLAPEKTRFHPNLRLRLSRLQCTIRTSARSVTGRAAGGCRSTFTAAIFVEIFI